MSALAEIVQSEMPTPILFTDSAAAKVADLIAEEGNPELKLRVFVQGGGCSGFQYGFTFDEITNEDDTTMTKNGVSLLVDAMSYQYLLGAEIDYKEDLQGAQFVIKNPKRWWPNGEGEQHLYTIETKFIYPGTFDPITYGHIDVIKKSLKICSLLTSRKEGQ